MVQNSTYTSQQGTILQSLIAYVQNPSNWANGTQLLTDFTPGDPLYTLLSAVSVGIDALGLAIYMARLAAYISTAVGSDLDNKVADFGLTRKSAVGATGTFTFYTLNAPSSNITIPAGTLITTIGTPSVPAQVYATTSTATLLAGQTAVNASATDSIAGSAGNIGANTQLLIGSAVNGIDGVTISTNVTDGADQETDAELRARGLAAFPALAHGTAVSYQELVLAVAGVVSCQVVPQDRGPGTVDIYIEGPNGSIPSSAVQTEAQNAVNAGKVATDDVLVLLPSPYTITASVNVHLATGFDPGVTSAAVQSAIINYVDGLGVGAGNVGWIYASQLVATALGVTGVVNATTTFSDTQIYGSEVPVATTDSVTVDTI